MTTPSLPTMPLETALWSTLLAVSILGILYPPLIYPLVLWAQARGRRAPPAPLPSVSVPGFTVIIPAHNEEKVIRAKLENTLRSADRAGVPAQVIVAADGCTDDTCDIVRGFDGRVTLVEVEHRGGIVGAFKAGLARSQYEVVFFSDADILLDADTFAVMVRHFADPAVGGVCGSTRMSVRDGSGLDAERVNVAYRRWVRLHQSRVHSSIGADGANWAVRRSLLEWPTNSQLAEDLVVPLQVVRQGYRFVYEPDGGALETSPGSVSDEFHRKVRTIAGGIQAGAYCRWMFTRAHAATGFHYASWKLGKYLISLWLLLAALSLGMLASASPVFAALWVATLSAAALALLGGMMRRIAPAWTPRLLSAPWYAAVAASTPLFALSHILSRRATTLWRMAAR